MAILYTASTTAAQVIIDLFFKIKGKVILTTSISPSSLSAFFINTIAKYSPKLIILTSWDFLELQVVIAAITTDPVLSKVTSRLLKLDLAS